VELKILSWYLIGFGIIWLMFFIMKIIRPVEFSENIKRPYIYYIMFQGQAFRVQDYKLLGSVALLILSAILIGFLTDVRSGEQFWRVAAALGLVILLNAVFHHLAALAFKKAKYLFFIKHIYAVHAAYYMSFLAFLVIYFPYGELWIKKIILIISLLYFYGKYLGALRKANRDLGIKPYYIILYLCITEILPLAVVIFNITHSV